jgi:hypothetical protein
MCVVKIGCDEGRWLEEAQGCDQWRLQVVTVQVYKKTQVCGVQ